MVNISGASHQRFHSTIHWITQPVDNYSTFEKNGVWWISHIIGLALDYPLVSDLYSAWRHRHFYNCTRPGWHRHRVSWPRPIAEAPIQVPFNTTFRGKMRRHHKALCIRLDTNNKFLLKQCFFRKRISRSPFQMTEPDSCGVLGSPEITSTSTEGEVTRNHYCWKNAVWNYCRSYKT